MFLLIDNYDSFTWNLVHYLGELGVEVRVVRNDALSVEDIFAADVEACVISPGPCDPNHSGICLDFLVANIARPSPLPILGICLGHQALGQSLGAAIVRAPHPMHGKVSKISHQGSGIFKGLSHPLTATRYHSLIIDEKSCPNCLTVTARSEDDDLIMAVEHKHHPFYGVQFHPESIATEQGHDLLRNFIDIVGTP